MSDLFLNCFDDVDFCFFYFINLRKSHDSMETKIPSLYTRKRSIERLPISHSDPIHPAKQPLGHTPVRWSQVSPLQ